MVCLRVIYNRKNFHFLCDQPADRSFLHYLEISKAEARRRQEMSRALERVRERNRVLGFISKYDELTGLLNLRGFTEQIKNSAAAK